MTCYSPPVDCLLSIGAPATPWPDYASTCGLDASHISELISLATDLSARQGRAADPAIWAPAHAWRALGQLRAVAALPALLELLETADERDDDLAIQELPEVLASIGAGIVPGLAAYLADPNRPAFGRALVSSSLLKLASRQPDLRPDCVAALTGGLQQYATNPKDLNAFLISDLAGLKAVESAGTVEQAFAAGRVDQHMIGNFEDYQLDVGLLSERPTRRMDPGTSI